MSKNLKNTLKKTFMVSRGPFTVTCALISYFKHFMSVIARVYQRRSYAANVLKSKFRPTSAPRNGFLNTAK